MKKLIHRKYDFSLLLGENWINELVIENPTALAALIREFDAQIEGEEGDFVLSEADSILQIGKNVVFIKEPFSTDVNQRKILTKLYAELSEYVNDIFVQERTLFCQAYIQYMDYICEKSYLSLSYEETPEIQDIFKLAKIRIDCQTESLLEQIVEYIKVSKELLNQDIFVFLNLKLFLTKEELEALYNDCFNRKIHLILIEAVFQEKLSGEKVCVIDKDKCILYL